MNLFQGKILNVRFEFPNMAELFITPRKNENHKNLNLFKGSFLFPLLPQSKVLKGNFQKILQTTDLKMFQLICKVAHLKFLQTQTPPKFASAT